MCVGVHFSDLSVSSDAQTVPWWRLHDVAGYPNLEFFSPDVPIKEVFFSNFFVVECCLWFGGAG